MKKMYLLSSDRLTLEQVEDAKKSLLVKDFIYLPDRLQDLWSDIPADILTLKYYLQPFQLWLDDAEKYSYVLIQGDYGAIYHMVKYCLSKRRLCPVYAVKKKEVVEVTLPDSTIKKEDIFRHYQFRYY